MADRRYQKINAPMTEAAKADDVTITGDWTLTGTVDLSTSTLSLPSNVPLSDAAESISGAWTFGTTTTVDAQLQVLGGNYVSCYEQGNSAYCYMGMRDQAGFTPSHQAQWASTDGGAITMQAVEIADDATATFNTDGYGICFVHNNYNATAYAHFGLAGTSAPVDYGSGSLVSMGAANPDVDGRVNIWSNAGSGTLSIKNRLGSTRSFYLCYIGRVPN